MLQSDPTALHQNRKGKKYMQKLASFQEKTYMVNWLKRYFSHSDPHIPPFKAKGKEVYNIPWKTHIVNREKKTNKTKTDSQLPQ